jgi:hypothetical protein
MEAAARRITGGVTTLRHLKITIAVVQWFLAQDGNLTLSKGYFCYR